MRKTRLLAACATLCCLLHGCTDKLWVDNTSLDENNGTPFMIYANSSPDADTRLAFGEDGLSLLWENGDQLVLVNAEKEMDAIYLTTELTEPSAQAVFKAQSGVPAGKYYVVNYTQSSYADMERWMTVNLEVGNDHVLHSKYALQELSDLRTAGIKMYAGPIDIEDGQTSVNVNLKHAFAMLKFNVTGADGVLTQNCYEQIGMVCPGKAFPTAMRMDNPQVPTKSTPKLRLNYYGLWNCNTTEAIAQLNACILPVDLTGQEVYFYLAETKEASMEGTRTEIVYEFKKNGKDS